MCLAIITLPLIVNTALYLVLAPPLFFLPPRAAHHKVIDFRDSAATEISGEFDAVFAKMRAMRSDDPSKLEPVLAKIRQLYEMRDLVLRFPVWPFNTETLSKYFALILSALLPAMISVITDKIA